MRIVMVAGFGALGALTRYGITSVVGARSFPFATLLINIIGSFALGVILTMATSRLRPDIAFGIGMGFLGAFTTFSTLSWDTFTLLRDGRILAATANVTLSIALGIFAAFCGYALGNRILGITPGS